MRPSDVRTALGAHLLRDALDATADPVEINDLDGRVVSVNDPWCRLFRRAREDVIGAPWDSTETISLGVPALRRCWAQCRATGHCGGVFDLGRADGSVSRVSFARWLSWNPQEADDAVVTIYRAASDDTGA
jgi:PAS domain-containing protein